MGLSQDAEFSTMQISKFGVITEHRQSNKWQLTINLSHPQGHSVNDNILCNLYYITVDDTINSIVELGPHTLLAIVDIKSAATCPSSYLLAMEWGNNIHIAVCLPFGLHYTPKLFNIFSRLVALYLPTARDFTDLPLPG